MLAILFLVYAMPMRREKREEREERREEKRREEKKLIGSGKAKIFIE